MKVVCIWCIIVTVLRAFFLVETRTYVWSVAWERLREVHYVHRVWWSGSSWETERDNQTTFRLGLNRPHYIRGEGIGGGGAKHAAALRCFCLVFSLYV